MNLARALRLTLPALSSYSATLAQENIGTISFVGAGGKTTAMFQTARELIQSGVPSIFLTATAHLGTWQTSLADHHLVANTVEDLAHIPPSGLTLITGNVEDERTNPVNQTILSWLRANAGEHHITLLIEADGARQKSLKAPAVHEPPIPEFTDIVIVVAGLSTIGKPLTDEFVHRAEIFSQLSGLQTGQPIMPDTFTQILTHPQGGLKSIPSKSRRVVFLSQADTPQLQSIGGNIARQLLNHFDSVIVGALRSESSEQAFQTFEHCAGIILAAGQSTRFGSPKQLLDWKGKPFVRQVAETALQAGLWPVVVVTGFHSAEIESALKGLPVSIVNNSDYQQGQSTSIQAGIHALPLNIGASVFLLADQPQIPVEVIRALVESHTRELQPILAPLVLEERRANPVLFDRVAFPDLLKLKGDIGGRGIFDKHRVEYLPWHDDILLFDVDKLEDYQRLKDLE